MENKAEDESLRKEARKIAERHFEAVHKRRESFKPGKTYIKYSGRVYDAEEIKSLMEASLDFWLTSGRFARRFEKEFSEFLGAKYCSLTNSGSSANLLAVSALTSPKLGERHLKPGDEVITVACAFPTTVNPIIQNGLVPVFLDVNQDTLNIDCSRIEEAVTDKTKAIFLAHTLGNPFDLDTVGRVCKKHGLWLIEDNCDALGSKYKGKHTGTFGHISTCSFYPPHHMTMGEGGALVTNDTQLKRLIESFRDWGRDCWCEPGHDDTCKKRFKWKLGTLPYGYDHKYIYSHRGYNLKLTDMQAAIGVEQLRKLPGFVDARKRNWKGLHARLNEHENLLSFAKPTENSDPSWFGFPITVKDGAPFSRTDIVSYLEDNKIATRLLFSGNITRQPCFNGVEHRTVGGLEKTDKIMNNTFWVGVYPGITEEMLDYMAERIGSFLKSRRGGR